MIERRNERRRAAAAQRPVPPTPRQELFGVLAFVLVVIISERISYDLQSNVAQGWILLTSTVYLAVRCGIRAGVIGTLFLVADVWIKYHYPKYFFVQNRSLGLMATVWTLNIFLGIVLIAGIIQNRFRAARTREFDARADAEAELAQRRAAEAELLESNAKLEERVAQRTAQLEAANSELVAFTYSVSHDLRAPLRAIVANSRMVCEDAEGELSPANYERLKRLDKNALRMAELIENLLQFARIGQAAMNVRDLDLSAMSKEIAEDLNTIKEGSAQIQDGLRARGDPDMIKMVLFNLMDNAWKYAPPGKRPEVEVGAADGDAFFVRDRGIGFDMRYVDKIWEPFERLHRDSDYPGTGIGLANCKRIVARHGGKMWAESSQGEGTTIYFALALA